MPNAARVIESRRHRPNLVTYGRRTVVAPLAQVAQPAHALLSTPATPPAASAGWVI